MPSQRKEGKKLVGFFATEEEARALLNAAEAAGLSVADWMRRAIREADKSASKKTPPKKKPNS